MENLVLFEPVSRRRKLRGATLLMCYYAPMNLFMWTDQPFVLFPGARLCEPQHAAFQIGLLRVEDPRSERKLGHNRHLARFHD